MSVPNFSNDWPSTPTAIMIMGKRQGTKKENKQLRGRVAMAAALWHSAPLPKPYIIFVASDVHGPARMPDAQVVKTLLTEKFEIPVDYLILRQRAHCTLLEVRTAQALSRIYGLTHLFPVTHLYHAPRAQRYFNETRLKAGVIPAHPAVLAEIAFPAAYADLWPQLAALVSASQPGGFDLLREHFIEGLLGLAHTFDRHGHFERRLAKLLRPTAYG
jgi:hypothetical protein